MVPDSRGWNPEIAEGRRGERHGSGIGTWRCGARAASSQAAMRMARRRNIHPDCAMHKMGNTFHIIYVAPMAY